LLTRQRRRARGAVGHVQGRGRVQEALPRLERQRDVLRGAARRRYRQRRTLPRHPQAVRHRAGRGRRMMSGREVAGGIAALLVTAGFLALIYFTNGWFVVAVMIAALVAAIFFIGAELARR